MKKAHMTLFVMTYCNKISLLQIPLSGHSFVHSFINLLIYARFWNVWKNFWKVNF